MMDKEIGRLGENSMESLIDTVGKRRVLLIPLVDLSECVDDREVRFHLLLKLSERLLDAKVSDNVARWEEGPPDVGSGDNGFQTGLHQLPGCIQLDVEDPARDRGVAKEQVSGPYTASHLPCQGGLADAGLAIEKDGAASRHIRVDQELNLQQRFSNQIMPTNGLHACQSGKGSPFLWHRLLERRARGGE